MTPASIRLSGLIALAIGSLAFGQQAGSTNPGGGTSTPSSTGGGAGNNNGGGRGTIQPQPTQPVPQQPPQPVYVSGTVVLADGSEVPEHVAIERVCGVNQVRVEGYTDAKGHFSLILGQNQAFADASTGSFASSNLSAPGNGNPTFLGQSQAPTQNSGGLGSTSIESSLWSCELRGKLAGYRSDSISLGGRRYLDSPDVGYIVLYPMSKTQGLTESATAALAPKDARKAYEKGIEAIRKKKPEQAEKELRKAVELYAKHAPAWFELGKLAEGRSDAAEARRDYLASIEADSKFVYPYVQLYRLEFVAQDWQALADRTDALLRLNPYEFPDAFYFNSVALYQLKRYADAEKSARQAIQADWKRAIPKAHFVLALTLIQQNLLDDGLASLRTFLQVAPKNDSSIPQAEKLVAQITGQPAAAGPGQP